MNDRLKELVVSLKGIGFFFIFSMIIGAMEGGEEVVNDIIFVFGLMGIIASLYTLFFIKLKD